MARHGYADVPLEPRPAGCLVPLTSIQVAFWNHYVEAEQLSDARLSHASVRVLGPIDVILLRRSLEAVVRRHEPLRTRIVANARVPHQHLDVDYECNLNLIDLSSLSSTDRESKAANLAADFDKRKVDPSLGPLFDVLLLRLSEHEHVLLVMIDHIVSDATSCAILSSDIWGAYNQAVQGLPLIFPRPRLQFADYAVWQQRLHHACTREHESYWRSRLACVSTVQLPFDREPSSMELPKLVELEIPLGGDLSARLSATARRERALLPLTVLAIYATVISRWCNQRNIAMGFMTHGRYSSPELRNMIGCFAHCLPFRIEIAKDDCLLDVLKRVNLEFWAAHEHQSLAHVSEFATAFKPPVLFNWLPPGRMSYLDKPDAQVRIRTFSVPGQRVASESSPPLILVGLSDPTTGIVIKLCYRSDRFVPSTMALVRRSLYATAEALTQHPHMRVSEIGLE